MSLVRAELRRLTKRRFTRAMAGAMLLVLVTVLVSMSLASKQRTPEVVAAAQAQAQVEYREQAARHQQMVADCQAAKARGEDVSKFGPDCGKEYAPTPDQFSADWNLPFEFAFNELSHLLISVFFGVLALFAYLIGASYVGAEWNSGGMTNLLLWRPRRLPVLATKLGVLLGAVLTVGVGLGALWTLALWVVGKVDGRTGTMTSGAWQSLALTGLRGLLLALAVAAVGFGLASIGRHTAMALGVAVAIAVIGEIGVGGGLAIASVVHPERFVLSTYVVAWFQKSYTLMNWNSCNVDPTGQCQPTEFLITWQASALVIGVGTALVLAATMLTMRNRDIT